LFGGIDEVELNTVALERRRHKVSHLNRAEAASAGDANAEDCPIGAIQNEQEGGRPLQNPSHPWRQLHWAASYPMDCPSRTLALGGAGEGASGQHAPKMYFSCFRDIDGNKLCASWMACQGISQHLQMTAREPG
jgi:hypothetical protein